MKIFSSAKSSPCVIGVLTAQPDEGNKNFVVHTGASAWTGFSWLVIMHRYDLVNTAEHLGFRKRRRISCQTEQPLALKKVPAA